MPISHSNTKNYMFVDVSEEESIPNILETLYGKIPYNLFFKITSMIATKTGNSLECIYGQVSYLEYELIRNTILDICPGILED